MSSIKSPVRQLAWNYYTGKAGSLDEYRDKRRQIVEAVIAGAQIPEINPPDRVDSEDSESTELNPKHCTDDPVASSVSSQNKPATRVSKALISASIVILMMLGLLFYARTNRDDTLRPDIETATIQPLAPTAEPKLPEALTATLTNLFNSDFDSNEVAVFIEQWNALPPKSRNQLRNTPQLLAFTERVAQKTAELLTLAGAGASISETEKTSFEELISALGLAPPNWPISEDIYQIDNLLPLSDEGLEPDHESAQELTDVPDGESLEKTSLPPAPSPATATNEANRTEPLASMEFNSMSTALNARLPRVETAQVGNTQKVEKNPVSEQPPKNAIINHISRPASIVLSEREGCSARYSVKRSKSCADFLSSKIRGPKMVIVPPGKFLMGDPRRRGETPQVEISIAKTIGISAYEITERDYFFYCKNSDVRCPQPSEDPLMPVVDINWNEAMGYTEWLSGRTGKNYRLPTEAEWEYATRGGTTSRYPFGDRLMITQARFSQKNSIAQGPLSSGQPINSNPFGLYHTVGNVREWVADSWQDHHDQQIADGQARTGSGPRVVRGGSYADNEDGLRSSARQPLDQSTRDRYTGFRVVLELSAE